MRSVTPGWRGIAAVACAWAFVPLAVFPGASDAQNTAEVKMAAAKTRTFLFTYSATFTNLARGKVVKIWLPLPQTSAHQDVTMSKQKIPGKHSVGTDPVYGNKILFVEAAPENDATVA